MRRLLILAFTGLLLMSCGGGSSSSTSSSQVPVGTYRGTLNLTVSGGGVSVSDSGPIVIVVAADHTVTVGSFPGSAPLNGNTFTLSTPASSLNGPGLTCSGTLIFTGTFVNTTVTGNPSSKGLVCNGLSATLTGNYSGTLQAEIPRGTDADTDVTATIRRALEQIIGR